MEINTVLEVDRFAQALVREFGQVPENVTIKSTSVLKDAAETMELPADGLENARILGVKVKR